MSIFNNPEENYWRNLVTKAILVCMTVAVIVWFLPRNEGRQYRYDVGNHGCTALSSPSSTFQSTKPMKLSSTNRIR